MKSIGLLIFGINLRFGNLSPTKFPRKVESFAVALILLNGLIRIYALGLNLEAR